MQVALLGSAAAFLAPGVRGMSLGPGASVWKTGSRRCTTWSGPPIIMQ